MPPETQDTHRETVLRHPAGGVVRIDLPMSLDRFGQTVGALAPVGYELLASDNSASSDPASEVDEQARVIALKLCDDLLEVRAIADELAAALRMARGFLGFAVNSPNSAAHVADQALAAHAALDEGDQDGEMEDRS